MRFCVCFIIIDSPPAAAPSSVLSSSSLWLPWRCSLEDQHFEALLRQQQQETPVLVRRQVMLSTTMSANLWIKRYLHRPSHTEPVQKGKCSHWPDRAEHTSTRLRRTVESKHLNWRKDRIKTELLTVAHKFIQTFHRFLRVGTKHLQTFIFQITLYLLGQHIYVDNSLCCPTM